MTSGHHKIPGPGPGFKAAGRNEAGGGSLTMLFIGMVAGAVLMALFNGLPEGVPGNVGSGLKNLVARSQSPGVGTEQAPESTAPGLSAGRVELDFYEVLPDVGRVMMDDFPDPAPERNREERKVVYMIQAASLRKESDAESLRARLALSGYESAIQRVNVEDKGTYYRVRIGPYQSRRNVKNQIKKLRDIGIAAMMVQLDAG